VGYFSAGAFFHKRLALAIFGAKVSVAEVQITVWCLLGRKAGDNTQVLALADELGWGYREKRILARPWELLTHLGLRVTLAGIDRGKSSPLEPPWPDLVITAGRRNEPVARWIQRQSGGRTALVHIGRPWAPLSAWDLIVTTPQYFLPQQSNIHHNTLPLHHMSAGELESAGAELCERVGSLPRPWIAVLLGGDSGRFVFTPEKGARLGALCEELARVSGGALLVTDSPRTPRATGDALQARLGVPHRYHRWGEAGPNPYRGLLCEADAFVVTGESMSMLAEASAMGRPLFIFDMGDGEAAWWRLTHAWRYKPLSHRLAMRYGPARMRRDVGRIQDALVEDGRAFWLSEDTLGDGAAALEAAETEHLPAEALAQQELQHTAAAVRQLLTPR
jgi:mitochondrial fission protein ELM1